MNINFILQFNDLFSCYYRDCHSLTLSLSDCVTQTHKQRSTPHGCPLIKLTVCVVNGNDGRKWPFIHSLASVHSVAFSFFLCVCMSRYSHSGLLYYTKPWRCFSGQRRRPKMPCCCCYHDNLGEKNKKRNKSNLVQNASRIFFNLPSKPHHQLNESCTSVAIFAVYWTMCSLNVLVNVPLDIQSICQMGRLFLHKSVQEHTFQQLSRNSI